MSAARPAANRDRESNATAPTIRRRDPGRDSNCPDGPARGLAAIDSDAFLRLAALHAALAGEYEKLAASSKAWLPCLRDAEQQSPPMANNTNESKEAWPELLTAAELAKLLRIDPRTLREQVQRGDAPNPIPIGSRKRWRRTDVDAWLAQRGAP